MNTSLPSAESRPLQRIGQVVAGLLGFFVLFEPIWMLLPFAGFLYGSVLRIETLGRYPQTAWLTHFVFPVLTLGWVGPILAALGLLIFFIGAGLIYTAKLRRSGLVTRGLYRFVRHPQYIALTLFGAGILLTWGRAIMFVAFFLMMFAYYYLARREERICLDRFGQAYEAYRLRTSFIFPGDRRLRGLATRIPGRALPAWVRVPGTLLLTLGACFALMWLVNEIKVAHRHVPYLTQVVELGTADVDAMGVTMTSGESAGVAYVESGRLAVMRGPWRDASVAGVAERLLLKLRQSKQLEKFLEFTQGAGSDRAIVFCAPWETPGETTRQTQPAAGDASRRGPAPSAGGPDRMRLIMFRCTLADGATIGDALRDKSRRSIRAGCIAPVNLAGEAELVDGPVIRPGPGFPGEERWDHVMNQYASRPAMEGALAPTLALVPGQHGSTRLIMVKAPILRTRIDPTWADELFARLRTSPTLLARIRAMGAGGPVLPVVFPRPGSNWYREHHGKPRISLFVMMVRLREGTTLDKLFDEGSRDIQGAFTAELDMAIDAPADGVTEVVLIGPRRDLEERWRFFLSGVGMRTP